ncbi:unnamed protein product [Brassica oleracea var. botrytis]
MKLSDVSESVKTNGEATIPSVPVKPVNQTGVSSGDDKAGDVSSAWNVQTKENVIQGFIPYGRIETYLRHMKAGGTYQLNKFFGSKSKPIYRVAEPDVTISFSWNSVLSDLEDNYVGHIKLVNGQVLSDGPLLDEAEIAASRRVDLHVQTHDKPVLKLYLWDKASFQFCEKFKASGGTAHVILVTTLNPKRFGGVLCLSSRVFLDSDVQETRFYLSWLDSNLDVANRVNAEVVTKPETATLGDLFSYMNQASAKVAWFECTSTIDDVVHGSGWYYIGCGVCHTKATKGPTTLMCRKCGKSEIDGDQAVFVVLRDAGEELTGKKAAELVERYYQANDNVEEDHIVPVSQAMIDTIGQTRKFIVKVSDHNLNGKSQTLTVTKVSLLKPQNPRSRQERTLMGNLIVRGVITI